MKTIETQSISRSAAGCTPIVLRKTDRVRLVFVPTMVNNPAKPHASVDGYFVYQRKTQSDRWIPVQTVALSTLKAGEGFKLELHAEELWTLFDEVLRLYQFYGQQGIPRGRKTFVEVNRTLAEFLSFGEDDLTKLLDAHSDDAAATLLRLIKWVTESSDRRQVASAITAMAPSEMPIFAGFLGLAMLKEALKYWSENQTNGSEEFWHQALLDRTYVLSQVFPYPVTVIGSKAYVGGKQITNTDGNLVDFFAATESTDAAVLIEIKTPNTKLLGPEYRQGIYPLSRDLSGAIAQILKYRQTFTANFHMVTHQIARRLVLGEPRCLVIAGNSESELRDSSMRESFELQRERLHGVTVVTYDELFYKLRQIINLLEEGCSHG